MGWLDELKELLCASNLRVTFDLDRDVTKPCIMCGSADGSQLLRVVGTYLNEHRDEVRRPVCSRCWDDVSAQLGGVISGAEQGDEDELGQRSGG